MGGEAARPLVDQIIAAKKGYDDSDKPWLSKLADGQLKKIAANCGCATGDPVASSGADADKADKGGAGEAGADAGKEGADAGKAAESDTGKDAAKDAGKPEVTSSASAAPKQLTEAEWLAQAPPERREQMKSAMAEWEAGQVTRRKQIIEQSGGVLTEDKLKGKSREELDDLVAATKPRDFSGQGMQGHDPVAQAGKATQAPRMPGIPIGKGAAA